MIIINKNSVNTVITTLTEKVSISNPYFLFRFTSDYSREQVIFLASNVSAYTDRYDKFSITETSGTTDLSNGVISLTPTGEWTYEIFQQTSSSNLDINYTGALLETGKVRVVGVSDVVTKYDLTRKTYKGYG